MPVLVEVEILRNRLHLKGSPFFLKANKGIFTKSLPNSYQPYLLDRVVGKNSEVIRFL
jgi:hypothetical protein